MAARRPALEAGSCTPEALNKDFQSWFSGQHARTSEANTKGRSLHLDLKQKHMHRRQQFQCENPASSRRYSSRDAANMQDVPSYTLDRKQNMEGVQNDDSTMPRPQLEAASKTFEPLIGSGQAAKLLGNIHVKTLQRYARLGRLPGYQIAGHWYFRESELDAWLRSQLNSSCHPCRLLEESDGT